MFILIWNWLPGISYCVNQTLLRQGGNGQRGEDERCYLSWTATYKLLPCCFTYSILPGNNPVRWPHFMFEDTRPREILGNSRIPNSSSVLFQSPRFFHPFTLSPTCVQKFLDSPVKGSGRKTAVFHRMVRLDLIGWMTFEQRLEGHEGLRGRDEWGHASKVSPRTDRAKVQRQECQGGSEECQGGWSKAGAGWAKGTGVDEGREEKAARSYKTKEKVGPNPHQTTQLRICSNKDMKYFVPVPQGGMEVKRPQKYRPLFCQISFVKMDCHLV